MLKDSDYEEFLQPILSVYSELETELIKLIANKFDIYDEIGGSLEWWFKKLNETGLLTDEAITYIVEYSNIAVRDLYEQLETLGYKSIDYPAYRKAYIQNAITINPDNISLINVINSNNAQLKESLTLVRTKALEGVRNEFNKIANMAYLETQTGLYDYNTSIRKALINLADKGITTATFLRDGKEVNYGLESVIRMNVLTEFNHTANASNDLFINEMKAEYTAVSQHLGARDKYDDHRNHASWQGKVYKLNGSEKGYPNFKETTGYGLVDGLGGVNCRHNHRAYFPNISSPIEELIDIEENNRLYELQQKQRHYERSIREAKRRMVVAEESNDLEAFDKAKELMQKRSRKLNDFIKENSELRRDRNREAIIKR